MDPPASSGPSPQKTPKPQRPDPKNQPSTSQGTSGSKVHTPPRDPQPSTSQDRSASAEKSPPRDPQETSVQVSAPSFDNTDFGGTLHHKSLQANKNTSQFEIRNKRMVDLSTNHPPGTRFKVTVFRHTPYAAVPVISSKTAPNVKKAAVFSVNPPAVRWTKNRCGHISAMVPSTAESKIHLEFNTLPGEAAHVSGIRNHETTRRWRLCLQPLHPQFYPTAYYLDFQVFKVLKNPDRPLSRAAKAPEWNRWEMREQEKAAEVGRRIAGHHRIPLSEEIVQVVDGYLNLPQKKRQIIYTTLYPPPTRRLPPPDRTLPHWSDTVFKLVTNRQRADSADEIAATHRELATTQRELADLRKRMKARKTAKAHVTDSTAGTANHK